MELFSQCTPTRSATIQRASRWSAPSWRSVAFYIVRILLWHSQKVAHHPHVSTPHVKNFVPSASSLIPPSLSVGSHQSGTPQTAGSRVYGPPPRDFFCDARKVGAETAPLERATQEEAVRRQTPRRLFQGLGLGRFEFRRSRKTTRRAHCNKNPPRRAEERRRKFSEAAADASHWLTFLQRFKGRTPTQRNRQSGGRLSGVVREPSLRKIPWAQLDAVLAQYMDALSWSVERAGAASSTLGSGTRPPSPRFQKLVMADCHPHRRDGMVPNKTARVTTHASSDGCGSSQPLGSGDRPHGVVGLRCSVSPAICSPYGQIHWWGPSTTHGIGGFVFLYPAAEFSNTPCGNDAGAPSWAVSAPLDRPAWSCGAPADPRSALASTSC